MQPPVARDVRVLIAGPSRSLGDFEQILTEAGMHVVARCTSPKQILAALPTARPDVCLVDRALAGGGLVAAAAITAPRRTAKVLLVGGRGSAAELRAAKLAGAADSLPADVDARRLAAAVAALAERGQSRGRFAPSEPEPPVNRR